jgi:hypothetical protein
MNRIIKTIAFALLLSSINFISAPAANAGCQDYPESTTPACVAENLAIAKLAQEAYEAAQVARRLQEEQTARDNAARDAAERAATIAADNALAPDDCARSTNRYLQRCTDIETARAVAENEARSAAERAATLAADNALAPDDCARSTNRFLQRCIDIAVEKARVENETKNAADLAATLAADSALAPDDCARSTNRVTQRCGEIAAEKARIENEAISSIRKIGELDALQKLANDKYTANKCDQAANQLLQVCIDSKAGADAVKNEAKSLAKKLIETQASLTKPLVDENGEIILTALLRSKTLSSKDIKAVLDASSISANDKRSLSTYAQTLNNLKNIRTASNFKIPLSKTLSEEFSSSTPKICLVVGGAVKTLKPGVCTINVTFSTESGFEVQTSKKIVVRK